MITINVIGRLGTDAEVRESKSGSKYVTLRLATDEYRNGNKETVWFNIYDYTDRGVKMAQYWKKGTMLNVCGNETVSVYQSKQNGAWLPSRDIRAFSIDFVNGGSSGSTSTEASTEVKSSLTADCGTLQPPKVEATIPSFSTSASVEEIDDLPF